LFRDREIWQAHRHAEYICSLVESNVKEGSILVSTIRKMDWMVSIHYVYVDKENAPRKTGEDNSEWLCWTAKECYVISVKSWNGENTKGKRNEAALHKYRNITS